MHQSSIIAVFDFDHTLTKCDSLLPLLFYMKGFWKTSYYLAILGLDFVKFMMGNLTRQEVKEKILTQFFEGSSWIDMQNLGRHYADRRLDKFVKGEALQRLAWHQRQGHRCLLVSASLDFYLVPWAKRHGFETVLASRLELSAMKNVTGKLEGLNCWGPEKKTRLLAYLGPKESYQLYVYGDSRGDREILEMADFPFYKKFK